MFKLFAGLGILGVLLNIVIFVGLGIGWIMNVVKFIGGLGPLLSGHAATNAMVMEVLRAIGIIAAPLGGILGWF